MMAEGDSRRFELYNQLLVKCRSDPSCNHSLLTFHNTSMVYNLNFPGDGSALLRSVVTVVYCTVAAAGMLGNLLVLHLLRSTRAIVKSTINFFVFHLAVADFLLSLALPFWAVDAALDYSWPFGLAMCKVVTFLTGVNIYATVFFMTAMSFARFCLVATALKPAAPLGCKLYSAQVASALIWVGAMLFALPRGVFADLKMVEGSNDTICRYSFPEGTSWLGANHIMRILFGFLLPYVIITLSYLLLLRFLCRQRLNGVNRRRQANVYKSVAVVVLSFAICWFPYNVISLWHSLYLLGYVDLSPSYYFVQTYIFPLANCLAFTNTCLNPIIYCFVRREFRKALHSFVLKTSLSSVCKACLSVVNSNEGQSHIGQLAIPLNNMESQTAQSYTKRSGLPSSTLSPVPSPKGIYPLNNLT